MGKVVSRGELIALAGRAARGSRKVVFTNGCFDLLHPGHIHSLERIRSLGDVLVVGLNSDESVRELKGAARPIVGEQERAELLAGLAAVDFVTIFSEPTPREVVAALLPDVLAKGSDWNGAIVGREEVEGSGGKVVSIEMEPGYSTSAILQKIKALTTSSSGAPSSNLSSSVPSSSTPSSSTPSSTIPTRR